MDRPEHLPGNCQDVLETYLKSLRRLHQMAGRPSSSAVAASTRMSARTVNDVMAGRAVPTSEHLLRDLVERLSVMAHPDEPAEGTIAMYKTAIWRHWRLLQRIDQDHPTAPALNGTVYLDREAAAASSRQAPVPRAEAMETSATRVKGERTEEASGRATPIRVSVTIGAVASATLDNLAGPDTGLSKADVINRALQLYGDIMKITRSGGAIYIRETENAELERVRIL